MNICKERFYQTWRHLDAVGKPSIIWEKIKQQYTEPHRAYHNLSHIHHCLNQLELVWREATNPYLISWALYFHDYFYDIEDNLNELRSSVESTRTACSVKLATEFAIASGLLVLATKKHHVIETPLVARKDMEILLDIDLAILGKPWEQYDEYRKQVRQEYITVLWDIYAQKRAEILSNFLRRSQIFYFSFFFDRYEKQARKNLEQEIEFLTHRGVEHKVT